MTSYYLQNTYLTLSSKNLLSRRTRVRTCLKCHQYKTPLSIDSGHVVSQQSYHGPFHYLVCQPPGD